ncbi:NUMOD1 domain-containing DNA-binding protein [Amedibacillus sp. YH-ame6]
MKDEIVIYLIENKINRKRYIGQTVNYSERMKQHIYGRNNGRNSMVDRAIKKYGVNNFEFRIIAVSTNQIDADEKERLYIEKYNSLKPKGYNILRGGRSQQGAWNTRKVYMYSLNGKYIRQFDSSKQVERWSNSFYLREGVRDCCNGKVKRCKDKIFSFEKLDTVEPYCKPKSCKMKPVFQFSLDGKMIAVYKSVTDASVVTETSRTSILGCLSGIYKTANGYLWSYTDEHKSVSCEIKRTEIYQLDEEKNIINEFPSCASAERALNLRKGAYKTIYSVLGKNKKRYGYYWLRK